MAAVGAGVGVVASTTNFGFAFIVSAAGAVPIRFFGRRRGAGVRGVWVAAAPFFGAILTAGAGGVIVLDGCGGLKDPVDAGVAT